MILAFVLLSLSSYQEPAGYFSNPIYTDYGIVVTDDYCSAIYLINNNKIEKILSSPGCGRYYTHSPDGNYLGFKLITEDGLQQPAVYDLKSHKVRKLHAPVYQCGQVSFSDNGAIAFTADTKLVVVKGSNITAHGLGVYSNIAPISPDGEFVVYNDNQDQLWMKNLGTYDDICITDSKQGYCYPQWSPDNRFILYSSLSGDIKVYDVSRKQTFQIGTGINPGWSADSKCLIYHCPETDGRRLTGSDIFISNYDGTEKTNITNTPDIFEMDARLFHDSRKMIFHTYDRREICIARIENNELRTMETAYSAGRPFKINYYKVTTGFKTLDSLDVPYLHQVYDTPGWFDGNWACAPTTAMMAIAYYRKLPFWDCWCSMPYGHTSHFGRYVCERYHYREVDYNLQADDPGGTPAMGGYGYMWYNGYSPHSRIANYMSYHNIVSWTADSPTWDETLAEINAGYPYCMCVLLTTAGHLVLAVGQVSNWHTLIFNDPYGNKNQGYMNYNGKYARYDWPGYNNGYANLNQVAWCAGAEGSWEPPSDTIVDDLQFEDGFYLHTDAPSTMAYWWDALSGFRGHMWWTYSTAAATDTCYATWTPNLPQSDAYEVFVYIPAVNAGATSARYVVYYNGGNQTVVINQANYSSQWVSLGTYDFNTSGSYVYLGDGTGIQGQHLGFDAVRWSYQGTGVNEFNAQNKNSVVPKLNPVKDNIAFTINLSTAQIVEISLYDNTGRHVYTYNRGILNAGLHNIKINTSHLSAGVYILKVMIGSKETYNKCVIMR